MNPVNTEETEEACCGGPAPAGVAACCAKDAEAKASGESGCGCGAARTMPMREQDDIRNLVREQYARVAESEGGGCGGGPACCASSSTVGALSRELGYSEDDIHTVPTGANMGLGCGNPGAIAGLNPGEVVLDLGSGGGFDCFLAARQVGNTGRVIGVDMTPEMISKARENARKGGYGNVEFRLGEIESLPLPDQSVDVILSNCVINLSPDKPRVFAEAYRVLKPGGRLAISDVVAFSELPEAIRRDMALYTGCMAGASLVSEVETMLRNAGFTDILVRPRDESKSFIGNWAPGTDITEYVVSATIEGIRPAS